MGGERENGGTGKARGSQGGRLISPNGGKGVD